MSNLNLEPFELSKWKDVLKKIDGTGYSKIDEHLNKTYYNIYKGLNTNFDDLDFWYISKETDDVVLEERNNGVTFIEIKKSADRVNKDLHLDLSTSALPFKPNTYYTILLELDFSGEGKLPNWEAYIREHPQAIYTNLFSLLGPTGENSEYNMPQSIFDSSLVIKYGELGFNIADSYLANDDVATLFVDSLQPPSSDNPTKILKLLVHVRTNDFLKNNYTLGLFSFLESWAGDNWKAKVKISVFEDDEEEPNNYYDFLYNEYKTQNMLLSSNSSSDNNEDASIESKLKEQLKKILPATEDVLGADIFLSPLKGKITDVIEEYYKDLYLLFESYVEEVINGYIPENVTETEQDKNRKIKAKICGDFLKSSEKGGVREEYIDILKNKSRQIAHLLHKYFPCVSFPYISDLNENNFVYSFFYTKNSTNTRNDEKIIFNNMINNVGNLSNIYKQVFSGSFSLLPITNSESENESENENEYFLGFNDNDSNTHCNFLNTNDDYIKAAVSLDDIIDKMKKRYWDNFIKEINNTNKNLLYEYISSIYDLNKKNIFFNVNGRQFLIDDNEKIPSYGMGMSLDFFSRYGYIFMYYSYIREFCQNLYKRHQDYFHNIKNEKYITPFLTLLGISALKEDCLKSENFSYENCRNAGIGTDFEAFSLMCSLSYNNNNNIVPLNRGIRYLGEEDFSIFKNFFFKEGAYRFKLTVDNLDFLEDLKQGQNLENFLITAPFKADSYYFDEEKQFIFGQQDGLPSFAQDIIFTESTKNDIDTISFTLYNNYYDGSFLTKNPFIEQLKEEDRIKLKYKNKWYDFIITNSEYDSINHRQNYIAKNRFVKELSKIGFNKTFNTELDNNVGTITELATTALKDTGWEVGKSDKLIQGGLRPVIGGVLKENFDFETLDYFYNENLEKTSRTRTQVSFREDDFVYLFYDKEDSASSYKIIIPKNYDFVSGIRNTDYEVVNNILTNIYIIPFIKINENDPSIVEYTVENKDIKITTLDIFKRVYFNYGLRAKDIVIKPFMHYYSTLKRYVNEYQVLDENNKTLYGYVESRYSTTPLVQNLLANGEDFTSLNGWINGALNNIFSVELGLNAATREADISTITPYLNFKTSVESYNNINESHGFVCNTDLGYNFSVLKSLEPGEDFILRVQVERGKNFTPLTTTSLNAIDDQLTLMETMHPYIYSYDNAYKLQSKNDASILPSREQMVMNFIQEKRFQNLEKKLSVGEDDGHFNCGISVLSNDYRYPYTASTILDLKDRINMEGLVSLHWTNHQDSSPLSEVNNINDFPIAYIPQKVANSWVGAGYIAPFESFSIMKTKVGNNKKYGLLAKGRNMIQRLVDNTFYPDNERADDEGVFHLRDFFIVADKIVNVKNGSNNIPKDPMPPEETTEIKYYLPMLFSDAELWGLMNLGNPNGLNNNSPAEYYFHKNFFKFKRDGELLCWTALENKEYYTLLRPEGGQAKEFNAYPENININFVDGESNIACSCARDYNDFDLLMRMRNFWYLKQYSREGTCIFETSGTFRGKPLKESGEYYYRIGENNAEGYTHQELLSKHLGLFFIFDRTIYDDGAKGHSQIAISKTELFRKFIDENNNLILPDKIISSNTTPIYYLFDPEKNCGISKKEDIIYEYKNTKMDTNKYKLSIDLTGEKRNSITITESNIYNILQKLAEIFECWLVIDVLYDENTGAILLDESNDYKPIKRVHFINSYYQDNFSGIKYGINLQKNVRKIDSNDIITKLIVKNNNNEFGKNGLCSIARSQYNLSGSNVIFNLDYFINTGQLPEKIRDILYEEIYPKTYSYGQFLSNLISQRAEEVILLTHSQATSEYNRLIVEELKEKLADYLGRFEALNLSHYFPSIGGYTRAGIGYYIDNEEEKRRLPSGTQNIINMIIFYDSMLNGFTKRYKDSVKEYNENSNKYEVLKEITEGVTKQRDALLNNFQSLCESYIKEGAWSSEDYIDDDLYYLDGERQLQEYMQPRVTYDINIVDLSSLPGYEAYNFNLRDKTTIEDPEMFGYNENGSPIKEEIIITEKSSYLQSPDKNTITVQNYKTQFDDLIQRISSVIQAVEFGTGNYTNKNTDNSLDNKVSNNTTDLQALKMYNKF